MGAIIKTILFSIVKGYVLPKILDEIIDYLDKKAKDITVTEIDDSIVDGIKAHKDEIITQIKKAI